VNGFLQRVQAGCTARQLFSRGQKILVAVSGGADSMVLLHALHALAKQNRWNIFVTHFNHQLRGRASDADEKLVRQTAAKLRLKFIAGGADVKKVATRSKISVEMAARKLRHEFLARTAREQKIPDVALAHHADDQVELFFLRLLRGAGGNGLAGMKWRSPSPADKAILLVRPLLDFSKAELLAFARENKIRFRDDATNFSTDFLRNRIRNELLPLLRKKYQPGLDKTVLRLMNIIGAEAEFVSASARNWERRHLAGGLRRKTQIHAGRMPALPGTGFEKLPLAVQRKVLQRQLTQLGLLPDFELVEQLRETPAKAVNVGAGLSVVRNAAGKVGCREHASSEFNPAELKLKFPGGAGETEFGGRKFRWQIQPRKKFQLPKQHTGKMPVPLKQTEFFDADKVGGEIVLRHWRAGDRFEPIGMKSAVKLQDLFVNAKIPAARRRELVLATTAAGEVFWVEGLRIGEQFKLTSETKRKLLWHWSK
jgi:tRNA(Ile)-lysidine synthase